MLQPGTDPVLFAGAANLTGYKHSVGVYPYPLLPMCHLSCAGAHQLGPVWLGDWDAPGIIIQEL